jgi:hypothetical protein
MQGIAFMAMDASFRDVKTVVLSSNISYIAK